MLFHSLYPGIYIDVGFIFVTSLFLEQPFRLLAALIGPGQPCDECFQGPVQKFERRGCCCCIPLISRLIVHISFLGLWNIPPVRFTGLSSSLIHFEESPLLFACFSRVGRLLETGSLPVELPVVFMGFLSWPVTPSGAIRWVTSSSRGPIGPSSV